MKVDQYTWECDICHERSDGDFRCWICSEARSQDVCVECCMQEDNENDVKRTDESR